MGRNLRSAMVGGTAGLLLVAGAVTAAMAEEKEEKVELNALPASVRATAEANAQGGKLTEAELETEDGQQIYSIEVKKDGGEELELEIAPDGKLLKVEKEDDDGDEDEGREEKGDKEIRIEVSQAPEAVQSALSQFLKEGATSVTLVREKERGREVFEAEYFMAGVEHSLKLAANGAVLEQENTVETSSLPAEVSAAIQKKFPGAEIKESEEVTERFYELEITANGKKREVKVSGAGQILGHDDDDDEDEDDD